MKEPCRWLLLCLLPFVAGAVRADGLVLQVTPTTALRGEVVRLVITPPQRFSGTVDLHPLLHDFAILSTATHGEMTVDHNRVLQHVQWTVTLLPKRAGHLFIPPLQIGSQRSDPIPLTVLPPK